MGLFLPDFIDLKISFVLYFKHKRGSTSQKIVYAVLKGGSEDWCQCANCHRSRRRPVEKVGMRVETFLWQLPNAVVFVIYANKVCSNVGTEDPGPSARVL